ncbi:MAG: hypothetical protein M1834_008832 [Cirrosporium novae-zelandiae]|nr:MAG: hypothetical protein M1834_008832 [Cirrosporium novae-zelandiae]
MSPQRYERVNEHDEDDSPIALQPSTAPIPSSPPPSFRSRASSPTSRPLLSQDPVVSEADQTLADTFDDGSDSDDEDVDDRQRLMRATPPSPPTQPSDTQTNSASGNSNTGGNNRGESHTPRIERRVTELPMFNPSSIRTMAPNDGVFANLAAKPERGEKLEDQPPSYEQAAADATPPYWENTILAPGVSSDEVYVDGLPVGSLFSFVWNATISTSFQLVGFLLTYLLHTTHAAKNGSRAGLGLTLVQYGFYMRGSTDDATSDGDTTNYGAPPDPNSHDFNPASAVSGSTTTSTSSSTSSSSGIGSSEVLSYILMIVGWFILIRAVSDFLRARKHEQLVLRNPDSVLGSVPIIAEGERPETVV